MIVACRDYLSYIAIGENLKLANSVPLSHNAAVTAVIYSDLFKMLITASHDSSIIFWNIINGKKFLRIQNAHDTDEITAMCLDEEHRIVFSASINGSVKAWNVANGQLMQLFEPFDDSEITSLSYVDKKRTLISVGLSRKIVLYTDVSYEVFKIIFFKMLLKLK